MEIGIASGLVIIGIIVCCFQGNPGAVHIRGNAVERAPENSVGYITGSGK